jgi:hypothetical protein
MLLLFVWGNLFTAISTEIHTAVSTLWSLSDFSSLELTYLYHWQSHEKNIKGKIELSLEEGFFGKDVSISIERVVSCP